MFDPVIIILFFCFLCPRRWVHSVINMRLRFVPLLALAAVVGSALTGGALFVFPVFAFLMVQVLLLRLVLDAFGSDRFRPLAVPLLVLVSAIWSLEVALVAPVANHYDHAHFWVIDFMNRICGRWLLPVLQAAGVESAFAQMLGYTSETVAFVSLYMTPIHFLWGLAGFLMIYEILLRQGAIQAPRPALLSRAVPLPWVVVPGALFAISSLHPDSFTLTAMWRMGLAFYTVRGLWTAYLYLGTTRLGGAVFWCGLLVMTLHPPLFLAPAALTVVDGVFGLTARWMDDQTQRRRLGQRLERPLGLMARTYGWTIILSTILPLLFGRSLVRFHVPAALAAIAPQPVPSAAVVPMAFEGDIAFEIDRYEFPNVAGERPLTGLDSDEAEARCRTVGKRLCTADEWGIACSDGNQRRYMFEEPGRRYECNVSTSAGKLVRGELTPSGSLKTCHTHAGVYDMMGNAYEWIANDRSDGYWTLAGSFYGYHDDQTTSCHFTTLVHRAQVPDLHMDAVGFRCCR